MARKRKTPAARPESPADGAHLVAVRVIGPWEHKGVRLAPGELVRVIRRRAEWAVQCHCGEVMSNPEEN